MVRGVPQAWRLGAMVFIALVALFMLGPLVVVAGASLSASQFIAFPPQGLSLRWYGEVLGSSAYVDAAWVSLQIATGVTLAATFVGGAAAIGLHRWRHAGADILAAAFLSPLVIPTIIYAIGLLMLWSQWFGQVSMLALGLGHTLIAIPYVVRTTLAVLATADPFLEEAARTMGAGPFERLAFVVVPQCLPGLAAGAFFAFNISFDEAVLSLFLRTPTLTTLPVHIYGTLEFSPDPSVAAASTILIGVTVVLMLLIDRILGLGRVASA